jgi:hypothetical protein
MFSQKSITVLWQELHLNLFRKKMRFFRENQLPVSAARWQQVTMS